MYDQKLPIRAPPKKHLPCAAPTWVNRCLQTPRKTGAGPCPGGYPTQPQERTQQWLDTQPPGRVPFNLSLPPLPGAAPLLAHGFAGSDSPPEAPHPTTCSPNTLSYPWSPSFPVPVPPPLPHHPLTTASAVLFISACVAPAWLFAQTSVGAGRSAAGAACPWPAACCSAPSVMLLQGWGKGGGHLILWILKWRGWQAALGVCQGPASLWRGKRRGSGHGASAGAEGAPPSGGDLPWGPPAGTGAAPHHGTRAREVCGSCGMRGWGEIATPGRPASSSPREPSPARLLAAQDNGIQKVSMGAEFAFFFFPLQISIPWI